MGRTVIKEEMFPEIVEQYNSGGKTAAYDLIRSRYGVKNPYFVLARIKECTRYTYDSNIDQFIDDEISSSEDVFMDLNELCGTNVVKPQKEGDTASAKRLKEMEKLVHELMNDRLLTLSHYIALDSSTRTIFIDETSLKADGYQIVTH